MASNKKFEFFVSHTETGLLIPFKFKFKKTGGSTIEVWSNGKERSGHKNAGQFEGVIQDGAILKVSFKIWDGTYNIEYSCEASGETKKDENNPSPLEGSANGNQAKIIDVFIKF